LSVIESISNQLQEYFNKYDVIHSKQSGFRQNHPCYTALTRLINSWLKEADSGKYVGTVYLDLKKAFDLVDHKILLLKLKLYHFTEKSIRCFESYLSNRKQKIKYENLQSESRNIQSGVPQGSTLGPLLFPIYISMILPSCKIIIQHIYLQMTPLYLNPLQILLKYNITCKTA